MKLKKEIELKFNSIPPDIPEYERKINIENFYNTYARLNGLNKIGTYDPKTNTIITKTTS